MVRSALVALAVAGLVAGCGGGTPAAVTTVKPLRQFRVIFPEGLTRAQMIKQVGDVARIAESEIHGRKVKLSERAYAAATRRARVIPGFGSTRLPLEGFLFPDTYFFDKKSTSQFLAQEQLSEFRTMWDKVDMSYARSKNLTPYDIVKIASIPSVIP